MKNKIIYLLDLNQSEITKEILSLHLNSHNVSLVPVCINDLILITKKECPTVVCISESIESTKQIENLMGRYLKYALLNKKINLIEVVSGRNYSPLLDKMRNYHQFQLPMSYLKLADSIVKSIREFLKVNSAWPGGKRSRVSIKSLM